MLFPKVNKFNSVHISTV